MEILQTLEALSNLPGISGQESAVRSWICQQLDGICPYTIDPLGNVIATKQGAKKPRHNIMLSAHMDEVGFLVTTITKEGYLRFATVGGIDDRVIFGKPVEVGPNRIPGIIAGKPVHLAKDSELADPVPADKLLIDIGATSQEDAEQLAVPGDSVIFASTFATLGNGKIIGKALDDRAGCSILLDLIKTDLPYDCTFAFTVQEEIGCIGATAAAYTIAPDYAIVVESTTASDIAGVDAGDEVCFLGKGPVLSFQDRGTLYDLDFYHYALQQAKTLGIPCQSKLGVFGGNEAQAIQKSRGGTHVLAVSVPTRYLHSPSNMMCINDLADTHKLIEMLLRDASLWEATE